MLKSAPNIFKRKQKGTTLHRRLFMFFVMVSVFLLLSFAVLLMLFGINGNDEKNVLNHFKTELSGTLQNISNNFSRLSLGGISIAEKISSDCDDFFNRKHISASELDDNAHLIEPLLARQMPTLINTVNTHYCGGVFLILDASLNHETTRNTNHKSGVFIKKTQPTSTQEVNVKLHYLRGPAQLARDNKITLLGQWKMEYNVANQDFFNTTIEVARANPELPLSRLYYWSERVTLKGNSESGFLLCVPLRSSDGTVFGICGIEVSDRMFKSMFSPNTGSLDTIFTVAAPSCNDGYICTSKGIIAGNYYLTGTRLYDDLKLIEKTSRFEKYTSKHGRYGGKSTGLKLYPHNSPHASIANWKVAVLMPESHLTSAVKGNLPYFIYILLALLIISILISIYISRRYLQPVKEALNSIRTQQHESIQTAPYFEINDLFEYLATKDKEHDEELRKQEQHNQQLRDEVAKSIDEYEKAQLEISRLAYSRKQEIDPDLYQQFLEHLSTLTPTERNVFDLYISGKSAKEILEVMNIKENTLKYHNKNIYSKLGVSSRKELLRYATLMNQEESK